MKARLIGGAVNTVVNENGTELDIIQMAGVFKSLPSLQFQVKDDLAGCRWWASPFWHRLF